MSTFKYLGCILDESGTDKKECCMKLASEMRVAGIIRSLANARGLQLEYARVLHESLVIPVQMYGSETMIWKEKERSRIKAVQMDNLRGLLGIRRMDKVLNAWIRKLCSDERIDGVLWGISHMERMESDTIAKGIYVGSVLVIIQ